MPTANRTISKLEQALEEYARLIAIPVGDIAMRIAETDRHFHRVPEDTELAFTDAVPGQTVWGHAWGSAWLKGTFVVPDKLAGQKLMLYIRPRAYEGMLFVNQRCRGIFNSWTSGIDHRHETRVLTVAARPGERFDIAAEVYACHPCVGCHPRELSQEEAKSPDNFRWTFEAARVMLEDEEVLHFRHELFLLLSLQRSLPEHSLRSARVRHGLGKVFELIHAMPSESPRAEWRSGIIAARGVMRELLAAKNGTSAPRVGMSGQSHLDTAWLWPVTETIRKAARTFGNALEMLDLYPYYRFFQSATFHAELVRQHYPEMFERIQAAVAAGRWEPNGGMWVEADCNLTGGESLVRQFLYNDKFTRTWYDGYRGNCCWHQDSFGYNANLPQIMKLCNCDYFLTSKMEWNDTTRFPYDTFRWRGIDGSEVLAHFVGCNCWPAPGEFNTHWDKVVRDKEVTDRFYVAYGSGDGGGGPQEHMIECAAYLEDLEGCPKAKHVALRDFMIELDRDLRPGLPVYSGDLYLENHRGTFTSIHAIKRGNRRSEQALRAAEIACAVAGGEYPAAELEALWKKLSVNQFHDVLPGSSIPEVNRTAIAELGECEQAANAILERALGQCMKSDIGAMTLFHLHDRPFRGLVMLPRMPQECEQVQPIRTLFGEAGFLAGPIEIPGFGLNTLTATPTRPQTAAPDVFRYADGMLETPFAIIRFDRFYRIVSLIDRADRIEYVAAGQTLNDILLGEDIPEQYDNWNIDADHWSKMQPQLRDVTAEVVGIGPLEFRLRVTRPIGMASHLTQDIVCRSDSPQITFESRLDWKDRHCLLKAAFHTAFAAGIARTEIPFGHQQQPMFLQHEAGRARFEVCQHRWSDCSAATAGLALLNDGKYGIRIDAGMMALSLQKSGTHPDYTADCGIHEFSYAILPHRAFDARAVVDVAGRFNSGIRVFDGRRATGFEPLPAFPDTGVVIETIKRAEDDSGWIVRAYEATGGPVVWSWTIPARWGDTVRETNLLEDHLVPVPVVDGVIQVHFRPFELKTFLIHRQDRTL